MAAHTEPAPSAQAATLCRFDLMFRWTVAEVTKRIEPDPNPIDLTEDSAPEHQAIEDEFRRRLFGLRRMRPGDKPAALRAAKDVRAMALKALRAKRDRDRVMTQLFRQLRAPEPR